MELDLFFFFDKLGLSCKVFLRALPYMIFLLKKPILKTLRLVWKEPSPPLGMTFTGAIKMKGFTLIELLVVVLIVGILAAVAVPQYQTAVDKARAANHLVMLKNMHDAQVNYILANGTYATDFGKVDITMPQGYTAAHTYVYRYPNGVEYHLIMSAPNFVGVVDNQIKAVFQYGILTGIFNGKRFCIADEDNARAHRLCKALGGTEIWPRTYQLP